ncbi:hypothetical protein G9C85_00150 [Halorubellus sp. JP-L1]|uniref:hypothetical protein n=1 Tax=Halorubellus sp. JP-L1 TaxID=2715753 RepID=UPI00140E90F0|nr:hypothetical protein [Halorubellus sp. JP-L1]NHN40049.1 hypothetical protein [Halorubellus sp. JP-L1]
MTEGESLVDDVLAFTAVFAGTYVVISLLGFAFIALVHVTFGGSIGAWIVMVPAWAGVVTLVQVVAIENAQEANHA